MGETPTQEQIDMVLKAIMAGIYNIKLEVNSKPINFYQFAAQMAEYLDTIKPEMLEERALKKPV